VALVAGSQYGESDEVACVVGFVVDDGVPLPITNDGDRSRQRMLSRVALSRRCGRGGAGASPLLLKEAAAILIGKETKDAGSIDETANQVRKHASAFMVDNLGATLEYRQKMSGVMAKRAIKEALERAKS